MELRVVRVTRAWFAGFQKIVRMDSPSFGESSRVGIAGKSGFLLRKGRFGVSCRFPGSFPRLFARIGVQQV